MTQLSVIQTHAQTLMSSCVFCLNWYVIIIYSSDIWKRISAAERQQLTENQSEDGEFFMSFDDFKKNYTDIEMCSVSIDQLYDDESSK